MESLSGGSFCISKDGTIYVQAGVQTNCAGFAGIHVRISPNTTGEILFHTADSEGGEHIDGYGFRVPGASIPECFRDAIFEGAAKAFEKSEIKIGVVFELLDAIVHEIDATESRFKQAGYVAVERWFKSYPQNGAR